MLDNKQRSDLRGVRTRPLGGTPERCSGPMDLGKLPKEAQRALPRAKLLSLQALLTQEVRIPKT